MKGFFTVVDDDDVFVTFLDSMQLHGSSSSCWFAGQLEYRLNSILWKWFILYGGKALVLSINWVYSCFTAIEHQQNNFVKREMKMTQANEISYRYWTASWPLSSARCFECVARRYLREARVHRIRSPSNLVWGFEEELDHDNSQAFIIHTYHSYYTGAEDTTIAR